MAVLAVGPIALIRSLFKPSGTGKDENHHQVIIEVEACGICGTDLHIMDGEAYEPQLPFVLGHEPAGIVVKAHGEKSAKWLGKRVVPTIFKGCGSCDLCKNQNERLCTNLQFITGVMGRWGGFAAHLLLDESQLVEIPEGLNYVEAAALVDAGTTAVNACEKIPREFAGRVLIVGGGPIGMLAAEILRLRSLAPVIVEHHPLRLQWFMDRNFAAESNIDNVIDGQFDCVMDCAGSMATLAAGPRCLGPKGIFIIVGYKRQVPTDFSLISRKELTLTGVRSGTADHLKKVLELVGSGQIEQIPLSVWNLSDIGEAMKALKCGSECNKVVITIKEGSL